jgi:hypothetical protein
MATAKVPPSYSLPQSTTQSRIHLVGRNELQSTLNSQLRILPAPTVLNTEDIVRETLTVAHECGEALVGIDLRKDQLLVELVASLVVVRLRKAGAQ